MLHPVPNSGATRFGNADDGTAIIADEDSAVPAVGEDPDPGPDVD